MISLKNVSLKFTKEYYALYDVTMDIEQGECVALLGEKGSGKTTLLRALAGLEKINSGEIYIKDIPLKKIDFSCDVSMGYLPAVPVYKKNLFCKKKETVYYNLRYILQKRKIRQQDIEAIINKTLIDFNIEKLRDVKISDLSLFEKYLVSIARLCQRKLEVALIDNVFEDLTKEETDSLLKLISDNFVSKGVTTLIATSKDEIAEFASRTVRFKFGCIED